MADNYRRAVTGQKIFLKRDSWPDLVPKVEVNEQHQLPEVNQQQLPEPEVNQQQLLEPKIPVTSSGPEVKPCEVKPKAKKEVKKKHKKMQKVDIDLMEAIQASLALKKLKKTKDVRKKTTVIRRRGNLLDADQPALHKGKVSLGKKRLSVVKKKFISSRQIHPDKVQFTPNLLNFKTEMSRIKQNPDLNVDQITGRLDKFEINVEDCINDRKLTSEIVHTKKFKGYCKNLCGQDLKGAVSDLIGSLRKFQDKLHARDEIKAHAKRRYVCGFKESKKFILCNKAKALIIATNLEIDPNLPNYEVLSSLESAAVAKNVPVIYAGLAQEIGYWTLKKRKISALLIMDYDGANDKYNCMIERWEKGKADYLHLTNVVSDYLSTKRPKTQVNLDHIEKEIRENVLSKLRSYDEGEAKQVTNETL